MNHSLEHKNVRTEAISKHYGDNNPVTKVYPGLGYTVTSSTPKLILNGS